MSEVLDAEAASEAEHRRFGTTYRETRRVLDETIDHLNVRIRLEEDPVARMDLVLDRRFYAEERNRLERAYLDYQSDKAVMVPPSAELVRQITDLSKEAVRLTAANASVTAVIDLAGEALERYAEIQDI